MDLDLRHHWYFDKRFYSNLYSYEWWIWICNLRPTVSIGVTQGSVRFSSNTVRFSTNQEDFSNGVPTSPTRDAIGIATINASGIVTAIYILDGGEGYGSTPVITISAP